MNTINTDAVRTAFRDSSDARDLLRWAGHTALRLFAATATGAVVLLVTANIVFSDIPIHYETPIFGGLEPTAVVAGLTVMLPAVVMLSLARLAARRRDRSRHLATLAVVLFMPFISLAANITGASVLWAAYAFVYFILAAVHLPALATAGWVLDATSRATNAAE